jgi:predicted Na+-dependent transporter
MTVGLPGTGIGGLFYLLLIAIMPLRELALRIRRRASAPGGVRTVVTQLLLALGIVSALSLEAWLLVGFVNTASGPAGTQARILATEQAARTATWASFGSLLLCLFTLTLVRLFAKRPPRESLSCNYAHRAAFSQST